jgi:thiol-disulfide isomerase/thioredoxin
MGRGDWKAALGVAANVSVCLASAAVLLAVWGNLSVTRRAGPDGSVTATALLRGAKAPPIKGVDYGGADRTLLLFMTVHCSYCQASLPFFRELAEVPGAASSGGRKRAVVAVFPDAAPDVNVFEERENFRAESVAGYDLRLYGVSGTPTIILLSRQGRILQVWHGAPDKHTQDLIRFALLSG